MCKAGGKGRRYEAAVHTGTKRWSLNSDGGPETGEQGCRHGSIEEEGFSAVADRLETDAESTYFVTRSGTPLRKKAKCYAEVCRRPGLLWTNLTYGHRGQNEGEIRSATYSHISCLGDCGLL